MQSTLVQRPIRHIFFEYSFRRRTWFCRSATSLGPLFLWSSLSFCPNIGFAILALPSRLFNTVVAFSFLSSSIELEFFIHFSWLRKDHRSLDLSSLAKGPPPFVTYRHLQYSIWGHCQAIDTFHSRAITCDTSHNSNRINFQASSTSSMLEHAEQYRSRPADSTSPLSSLLSPSCSYVGFKWHFFPQLQVNISLPHFRTAAPSSLLFPFFLHCIVSFTWKDAGLPEREFLNF